MKITNLLIAVLFNVSLTIPTFGQTSKLPYQDANLPVEERVKDLIGRMTLEEKISQMEMKSLNAIKFDENGKIDNKTIEELFNGKSIGCLESPFIEHEKIALISEAADKYLRENTRLGIPAIQIAECLHGQLALGATIFPQSIGVGSTWNPELIYKMGAVIASEASMSGVDQALSPLFDLARDPRYGRVEECYGEDPFLVKQSAVAYVKGLQGDPKMTRNGLAPGKLAAMGKHFVAYSVPEAGINIAPSVVGERCLRELHLYPFEGAVKEANIYAIMPSYHEVDGVPMHSNKWLMQGVLRDEWKFDGYTFSDYGAIDMLHFMHKVAKDYEEACIQAINAGIDVEAPGIHAYGNIEKLIKEGKISEDQIDSAVSRILTTKFKMGLFDRPFKVDKNMKTKVHTKENIALSQQIAEESMVLLKNQDGILPLSKEQLKTIAVIGPNADKVQFGDYSPTKNNAYGITVLQGIRNYVGNDIEVKYALGCGITSLSEEGFEEAVETAKSSDVVVLVLGGTSMHLSGIGWGDQNSKELNTCGEGFDRNELNFPGIQPKLLQKLYETGKPIILVMINGRAYTIEEEVTKVNAILEAWYPGEMGGTAVARILFGEVNPSGRLSVTFPPTVGHIPMTGSYKPTARGFYHQPGSREKAGRDYVFSEPKPLFSFGYGLSYTTFEYSDLRIENNIDNGADSLYVSCTVKNIGDFDGAEVVQVYVRDMYSSTTTPVKALKAFDKINLKCQESKIVRLPVAKEDLKLWNPDMKHVLEPGDFEVYVGSSSDDIKLTGKFEIANPSVAGVKN